jgi:hypothetical protein
MALIILLKCLNCDVILVDKGTSLRNAEKNVFPVWLVDGISHV